MANYKKSKRVRVKDPSAEIREQADKYARRKLREEKAFKKKQKKRVTLRDLAGAAHDAGMRLEVDLKPRKDGLPLIHAAQSFPQVHTDIELAKLEKRLHVPEPPPAPGSSERTYDPIEDAFTPGVVKLTCGCSEERAARCKQVGYYEEPPPNGVGRVMRSTNRHCHIFVTEDELLDMARTITDARFASTKREEAQPKEVVDGASPV